MMDHERLWVGMQGLSIAEVAIKCHRVREDVPGPLSDGPVNTDGPMTPSLCIRTSVACS